MSYDRRWLEEVGSEDSHARAVWALGAVVRRARRARPSRLGPWPARAIGRARDRLHLAPRLGLRAAGLVDYLAVRPEDLRFARLRAALADRLRDHLRGNRRPDGPGSRMSCPTTMPGWHRRSMAAGEQADRSDWRDAGLETWTGCARCRPRRPGTSGPSARRASGGMAVRGRRSISNRSRPALPLPRASRRGGRRAACDGSPRRGAPSIGSSAPTILASRSTIRQRAAVAMVFSAIG